MIRASCLLVAIAACGDPSEPPVTVDAAIAIDSSVLPDAAPAASGSVMWVTDPDPVTITHDISLDYGYQYTLTHGETGGPYMLHIERCADRADQPAFCQTSMMPAMTGNRFMRWGLDPSQYALGENRYSFELKLVAGDRVLSTDRVELVVTVTGCQTCGT